MKIIVLLFVLFINISLAFASGTSIQKTTTLPDPQVKDTVICLVHTFTYTVPKPPGDYFCLWYKDSTSANAVYSGYSYTIEYENNYSSTRWVQFYKAGEYSNRVRFTVYFHSYPTAIIFAAPPVVCLGDKVSFIALTDQAGHASYAWNFGNGDSLAGAYPKASVLYNQLGEYTVSLEVRTPRGCNRKAKDYTVTVNVVPDKPVMSGPSMSSRGAVDTYFATSQQSIPWSKYQWSVTGGKFLSIPDKDSVVIQWHDTASEGHIVLIEKTIEGCFNSDSLVVPLFPLSVNPHFFSSVNIYPNPAKNTVTVISGIYGTYSLTDLAGKTWKEGNIEAAKEIDISSLPAGVFILQLFKDEKQVVSIKLLKQ